MSELPSSPVRDMAAVVLESLRDDQLHAVAEGHGLDVEELARARQAFLTGGTRALAEDGARGSWLQLNLAAPFESAEWEQLMLGGWQDRLVEWLDADPDHRMFFMHKDPGVRVRLRGAEAGWARLLREAGLLAEPAGRSTATAPYDAEICQMGGTTGLELAHRFFSAESVAVMAYHRCRLRDEAKLDPSEFSLLLLDRTLRAIVGDVWEIWDVWAKMVLTGRIARMPSQDDKPGAHAEVVRRTRSLLDQPARRLERASDTEQAIFARFAERLPALAGDTIAAATRGELLWGLREILPFWIIFHWNRLGLSTPRQRTLCRLMGWVYSPKALASGRAFE